jgi:putative ABC transport system permease protein
MTKGMRGARGARGTQGAGGARGGGVAGTLGLGAVSTVALAVLVLGCVFAATAGPRVALAARTRAVHQALAATTPLARTITATTTWSHLTENLGGDGQAGGTQNAGLAAGQLGEISSQLRGDFNTHFNRSLIHLAPAGTDWWAMLSQPHSVLAGIGGPARDDVVKLEVSYRQPLARYMRVVAGRLPGKVSAAALLRVAVSSQTAVKFGLHVGSKVRITGPEIFGPGGLAGITLEVTGIVVPREASAPYWAANPELAAPDLQCPECTPPQWVGGVFAGPGELGALQADFGAEDMAMQWVFPVEPGSAGGQQAQPLYDALNQLGSQAPQLSGNLAPARSALAVSSSLQQTLGTFLSTAGAVDALLWLLYVSLAVAALVTLVLAARMVATRRSPELAVRRARGASLAQIAAVTAGGAAVACVPAAVAGAVLGVLLVPGTTPAGGWWAPAALPLVAVCAAAATAAWQQRMPRGAAGRRVGRGGRVVAEATACLAAIAGIIVFRQQGAQPGAGVNLYTSAVPALVAVPAVIVVLRVYPVVLRGLLRGSARRPGAAAFVGLARASRASGTSLTPALPAFALVLALTVATFAGMLRDAVDRGDVAASWQSAGADVRIMATREIATTDLATFGLSPAAVRELTAVPGVTHAARVLRAAWNTPGGPQVIGLAVDPGEYATLVANTRTFPAVPARLLAPAAAGGVRRRAQPVLASPQAAAALGAGVTTLRTQADIAPVRVRVAGLLSATPALPGGGAFMIMPLSALRGAGTPAVVPVNELLLTGTNIDSARLATVMRDMVGAGVATLRSDIVDGLTGAPLQHGALVLFELSIAVAAAFGLAVMLFELALGAAERDTTLARLATMGLGEGQRARVVVLEVLPALVAAAVAATACAFALPWVARPAINLSVFTGSLADVELTPDVSSFALPLGGLAVATLAALYAQIRYGRRLVVAAIMRCGE